MNNVSLFDIVDDNSPTVDTLKEELLDNLLFLKSLDNRETMFYAKFELLRNIYINGTYSEKDINNVKNKIMTREDVDNFMNCNNNKIELIKADTPERSKIWGILTVFISSHAKNEFVGRSQKYYLEINNKYAGVICLNSDLMTIKVRDDFIGWTKKEINHKHKLNNTVLGGVLVPTQPFGYLTTGGKLLTFLAISDRIITDWENKYKDKIVVFDTTSLFGAASQYNGMSKYFKILGESSGKGIAIYPAKKIHLQNQKFLNNRLMEISEDMKQKIIKDINLDPSEKKWLINQIDKIDNYRIGAQKQIKYRTEVEYINELDSKLPKTIKDSVNFKLFKDINLANIGTTMKSNIINLFYKFTNFKEYIKEKTGSEIEFYHGFHRGVVYSEFYKNSKEFLRDEITENQLIPRDDWDFDRKDIYSIVNYWKNKYAIKRYNKLKDDKDNEKCYYNLFLDNAIKRIKEQYKGEFYNDDPKNIEKMFRDFVVYANENTEVETKKLLF